MSEPADQPHGARHGTILDPFGHRWMLSQPTEDVSLETYRARSEGSGYEVVTADPQAVWERCRAAGVDVVREPEAPAHDPEGMGFSVHDPEGNTWSFGTYGLGAG